MYKVIEKFKDLKDSEHVYEVGDVFPWDNRQVSKKRLRALSSDENKAGHPVIEEVIEESAEEPTEETEVKEEVE